MIINATERNFVKATKKNVTELQKQYDRYHDKRYYLARIRRRGKFLWGLKMFRRARQIEYFKRMRRK